MVIRQHRTRMNGAALLSVTVALLSAACLSGNLGASAAADASTTTPAKSPIKIEQISPQSIPGVIDNTGSLFAYFDYVNAHGGVDGHKIDVSECYAGTFISSSPNQATTCAQQAVANHVLSLVGSLNFFDADILPVVAAAHIADFGNFTISPIDDTNPDSYPLWVPGAIWDVGLGTELVKEGHCKSVGVIANSGTPGLAQEVNAADAGTKWAGGKVAPAVLVSTTETDFAPAVATIESEGATCIADEAAAGSSVALVTAAKQSGQVVKIAGVGPTFSPATISALGPLANGLYIDQTAQEGAQVTDAGYHNSAEKLFYEIMKQYAAADIPLGNSEWPAYVAAVSFVVVAKYMAAHGISFTPSNFQKSIPKVNLATDFYAPVSFATKGPIPGYPRIHATSINYLEVQNGAIVALSDTNFNVAEALIKYPNG